MFRKSIFAITMAALLGAAAATDRKTTTKTPNSGKHTLTKMNKVTGYDLCAVHNEFVEGSYVQGSGVSFTPVYGGACGTVDAERVGYFTSTCESNPYAGRAATYTRMSTGGATAQDTILSPCTALGALDNPSNWSPADCPVTPECVPFNDQPSVGQNASYCYYPGARAGYLEGPSFPFIPFGVNASVVQALADGFCNLVVPSIPILPVCARASSCCAEITPRTGTLVPSLSLTTPQ
jgi:hypothetical protein